MAAKISVTAACFILALVVPALEVNDTHLFSPTWPAHARLHEAWQLLSNVALSLLCLWLAWANSKPRLASAIMLSLTGSFLIAFLARGQYGGSMQHSDGTELMIAGFNPAVAVIAALSIALTIGILTDRGSSTNLGRTRPE